MLNGVSGNQVKQLWIYESYVDGSVSSIHTDRPADLVPYLVGDVSALSWFVVSNGGSSSWRTSASIANRPG